MSDLLKQLAEKVAALKVIGSDGDFETKARHVSSQAGVEHFKRPLGTELGTSGHPMPKFKPMKLTVIHGASDGPVALQASNSKESGSHPHTSMSEADDHIDDIMGAFQNIEHVHHEIGGHNFRVSNLGDIDHQQPSGRYKAVAVGSAMRGGKLKLARVDSGLVTRHSGLTSALRALADEQRNQSVEPVVTPPKLTPESVAKRASSIPKSTKVPVVPKKPVAQQDTDLGKLLNAPRPGVQSDMRSITDNALNELIARTHSSTPGNVAYRAERDRRKEAKSKVVPANGPGMEFLASHASAARGNTSKMTDSALAQIFNESRSSSIAVSNAKIEMDRRAKKPAAKLHTDSKGNGILPGDKIIIHTNLGDQPATVRGTRDGGGVMNIGKDRNNGIVDYTLDSGSEGSTLSSRVTTHGNAITSAAAHDITVTNHYHPKSV